MNGEGGGVEVVVVKCVGDGGVGNGGDLYNYRDAVRI